LFKLKSPIHTRSQIYSWFLVLNKKGIRYPANSKQSRKIWNRGLKPWWINPMRPSTSIMQKLGIPWELKPRQQIRKIIWPGNATTTKLTF
jgi:hypothetical protein